MTEANPYAVPSAVLENESSFPINTSGLGASYSMPEGVKGWSWGAFAWGWVWAVANRSHIGLLCLVPYLGIFMKFYLGVKGRELAWQNKKWDSLEHFNAVQRKWSLWALLPLAMVILGIAAAIIIPAIEK